MNIRKTETKIKLTQAKIKITQKKIKTTQTNIWKRKQRLKYRRKDYNNVGIWVVICGYHK